MRRANLLFAAALALVYLAVGPAGAENVVLNGQFNDELAGTWNQWASNCGDFTNQYEVPACTTVDITNQGTSRDPALTWYFWGDDLVVYPSAIGAKQMLGGASGLDTTNKSIVFSAEIVLMMQDDENPQSPDWCPALMGFTYKFDGSGNQFAEVRKFHVGGDTAHDQIPLGNTSPVTWILSDFFKDTAPGARITSVFFGGQGSYFQGQADNVVLDISTVPEPGGILALAAAFTGATAFRRRRR